jgi:UDP-3-O-[3-hydroxymyristoyl] N-acetylglucosamine deacetylase/3-hydroxyacyl-[acyl-carrier-protein] dehydratase
MPRRTLATSTQLEGTGLHTGARTRVHLQPASAGAGIFFCRDDLDGHPVVPARVAHVEATERRTRLARGEARVETVEHLLAAAHAWQLDDLEILIDGPEPPILDGSFLPWFEAIELAGIVEQDGDPATLRVDVPFTVREGEARYIVAPRRGLSITTTIEWDHPVIGRQSISHDLSPEAFRRDIAPARTFGFIDEVEKLQQRGLLQGATPEMAVVLSDTAVASGTLRWPDEFARHKLGDVIGDLALLGARVDAQIVAERPSHQGNVALGQAIARRGSRTDPTHLDVTRIMEVLPHRFPFLLVDRIIEMEAGVRIVGLKNVTMNEPFFQGHFPGHPIMPGVLIVEAMAQVGGMLMMGMVDAPASKVVYFASLDGVRFRRPVRPGDQLRFEVAVVKVRGTVVRTRGQAFVDGQIVCEAEMTATVMDR